MKTFAEQRTEVRLASVPIADSKGVGVSGMKALFAFEILCPYSCIKT